MILPDIKAAVFDLDGTLLDSLYVWQRIDELFFARRGMKVPENYGRDMAGKSYPECARYTKDRFHLPESEEDIIREWTNASEREYGDNVPLKRGAGEYLEFLKKNGVRLAVATALPEKLYKPCLERLGILSLFETVCSTTETGDKSKTDGSIFALAAAHMDLRNEDCMVFEDTFEGLNGAKAQGMQTCCVVDLTTEETRCGTISDRIIHSFHELAANRCVIFTGYCEDETLLPVRDIRDNDLILCADAGRYTAERLNIQPDLTIGDFDSSGRPEKNICIFPVEKDDTDTMLCVRHALGCGCREILLLGGLGGRLDHTLANLQTLNFIAAHGASGRLTDGKTSVWTVRNGTLHIPRSDGKLSVFALNGVCRGVVIRGAKYETEDLTLDGCFPIGMGNDFTADEAVITVGEGVLTVIREEKRFN